MSKVTLFCGVNGAGKTSLYMFQKSISNSFKDDERINPDEILKNSGGDWKNQKDVFKSGKIAILKLKECLNNNKSFNWETTLLSPFNIGILRSAKEKGFTINLMFVSVNTVEKAIERVKYRESLGGHGIPEETIRHRFEKQFKNIDKVLGFVDTAVFFDNSDELKISAIYSEKKFVYYNDEVSWIKNIKGKDTKPEAKRDR